ncbi:hypothetical protein VNO77_10283 [Canavalia gladiata]|uniref:J domain-containing protein n=1 Tax=Canavalia gladiata TaxID=3824 RepID=A0AAN9MA86_CANGL
MASSKRPPNVGNSQTRTFGSNSGRNPKYSQNGSRSPQNSTFDFDYGVFSSTDNKAQRFGGVGDGIDDIFGGNAKSNVGNGVSFDYDSFFAGSNKPASTSSSSSPSHPYVDDIFGGMSERSVGVDDLFDNIGGLHANPKPSNGKSPDFDDLIPGFGGSGVSNNGEASFEMNKPNRTSNKPTSTSHSDPFFIFETASSTASSESFLDSLEQISNANNSKGTRGSSGASPILRSPPKPMSKVNNSRVSSIDELEDFARGRVQTNASNRKANINIGEIKQTKINNGKRTPAARANQSNDMDDLESFFSTGDSRSSSVPKSRTATMDGTYDHKMNNNGKPEVSQRVPSGSSASVKKSSVMTSLDDLDLIFGASPSSEFKEVEGETEERRRARLGRHQRTQERALKAVADMNQRDLQTKIEQEERQRIADTVDVQIKWWSAGKEGNMRALLSTLQNVLWPECGWQPVSLTDMITSASVKKVYRKATLYIHPDKVQQKGASLQQKYTAEKVFDILKEAWSKFSAEELS